MEAAGLRAQNESERKTGGEAGAKSGGKIIRNEQGCNGFFNRLNARVLDRKSLLVCVRVFS